MKTLSRRDFLGMSLKAGAATMFAGMFAPTATSLMGLGGIAHASTKKICSAD